MPDLHKLQLQKEKIISTIKIKGPSFPARIARATDISPLFASAYLSELVKERKLKLSNMKVGSSPLYYIEGQEPELENFSDYLNHKEKEAFMLLKKSEILEDEKQEPSIRVAIRKIKDFALPISARVDGKTKLFWKFFSLPQNQTKARILEILNPQKPKSPNQESQKPSPKSEETSKTIEPIFEQKALPIKSPVKTKTPQTTPFAESIKSHLSKKDFEVTSEISQKKKEFISTIRLDTHLGKQEYYTIAKDKKKITENDLVLAFQKAQSEKMPSLVISPGDLDKKAQAYLDQWKNLIKFEKLKS
jgi:hypothetical protein